jgi:hypothetical protein
MTYWFGWLFYAVSLALAVGYAVLFILVSIVVVGVDPFSGLGSVVALFVPALVISGLGRDVLYLLARK